MPIRNPTFVSSACRGDGRRSTSIPGRRSRSSVDDSRAGDVPSPIDFHAMAEAEAWAATAMVKRPWREAVFQRFVTELETQGARTVLELGSGPGFLARRILEALPS